MRPSAKGCYLCIVFINICAWVQSHISHRLSVTHFQNKCIDWRHALAKNLYNRSYHLGPKGHKNQDPFLAFCSFISFYPFWDESTNGQSSVALPLPVYSQSHILCRWKGRSFFFFKTSCPSVLLSLCSGNGITVKLQYIVKPVLLFISLTVVPG